MQAAIVGTAVLSSVSFGALLLAPVSDWRCRSPHARSAVCGSVRRCWCLALAALYDAMPMVNYLQSYVHVIRRAIKAFAMV